VSRSLGWFLKEIGIQPQPADQRGALSDGLHQIMGPETAISDKGEMPFGSPIVDEALLRIAALYKLEDAIRGANPDHRRAVRQEMSRPLVDEFFTWLKAQAARVSRKSDLGEAMAYMLKRQDGFRLFLDDGHVDIDSNLVENAIRSPAMNRRNALFAGHDEGGKSWARFASLIGSCKMNGVEPYAYLRDLFTKLANGHLDKDIDTLMPWAYPRQTEGS
jgi:transposase